MLIKCFALVALLGLPYVESSSAEKKSQEEFLKEESNSILESSLRIASQFYTLEEGEEIKDMTQAILESTETKNHLKQHILSTGRRFFLFRYPSDHYQVKGYLSFVPNAYDNPLLIFLRGGNEIFGLMHPASDFTCIRNYTVITTTYRGGVSEGEDEFGGEEVNDVHHLLEYFPVLAQKLHLHLQPKGIFMLGGSRGGMEMFLALGRSPVLQQQISKAASLSGLLDMRTCLDDRKDMKKMFIKHFGLIPYENEEQWIAERNPLNMVPKLRKDLPFLIIQGTDDLRVSLNQGYHMIKTLKDNGNRVEYFEIPHGNHCLSNHPHRMEWIADWFEQ